MPDVLTTDKEVSPRELIKRLSFKDNLRINEDDVVVADGQKGGGTILEQWGRHLRDATTSPFATLPASEKFGICLKAKSALVVFPL